MNKHVTVLNLDPDLSAELEPFMWLGELKTGKFALWERDMFASMVTLANTVQAQRVALREVVPLVKEGLWDEYATSTLWEDERTCDYCYRTLEDANENYPHADDCLIRRARAWLAQHAPESGDDDATTRG
jgi:hypothetical protein